MKKSIVFLMLACVALLASCTSAREVSMTLADVPAGKTWTVFSATVNDKDVPAADYREFSVTFNKNGSYLVTDKGDTKFVFFGAKSGNWSVTNVPSQGFSIQVATSRYLFVKETSKFLTPTTLNLEYVDEVPGATVVRKFMLVRN